MIANNKGFSLIELMIVVVIIGVLAAMALPSYQAYLKRSRFSEIVQACAPYKLGVSLCFQTQGSLNLCNSGRYGIPKAIASGSHQGLLDTLVVAKGVIKATPKSLYGITSEDTYILKPQIEHHHLNWKAEGGGVAKGYVG